MEGSLFFLSVKIFTVIPIAIGGGVKSPNNQCNHPKIGEIIKVKLQPNARRLRLL